MGQRTMHSYRRRCRKYLNEPPPWKRLTELLRVTLFWRWLEGWT